MMTIDLHMHTKFSDGTLSCEEIINKVQDLGLELFSITDHEDVQSIKETRRIIKEKNLDIAYIAGVEIAATYLSKEFHLTVYGFDEQDKHLQELLNRIRKMRLNFGIEVIQYIEKNIACDNKVKLKAFNDYREKPELGGWKTLNYLKEIGLVKTLEDYFILLKDCPLKSTFPSVSEVIAVSKEAGGYVFLAHPSSNQKFGLASNILDDFVEFGIDGIECYSQYCSSPDEALKYVDYCKANQLYISGGSDYHGDFIDRKFGNPIISREDISYELFMELSIRRGSDVVSSK